MIYEDIEKREIINWCIRYLIIFSVLFVIFGIFNSRIVYADDTVELDMDMNISKDGAPLEHNEAEVYYINEPLTISFTGVENDNSDERAVNTYLSMSVYDGEKFSDYVQTENESIDVISEIRGTEVYTDATRYAARFRKIVSEKYYAKSDEEKELVSAKESIFTSQTYQFIYDIASPEITCSRDDSTSGYLQDSESVSFLIRENVGLKEIRLYKNDEEADVVALSSDKRVVEYEYVFVNEHNNDGVNTIKIEAVDLAGNSSEFIFEFDIDRTKPEITVEGIEDGNIFCDSAKVNISAEDNSGNVYVYYKCIYTDENGSESIYENETSMYSGRMSFSREYSDEGIYDISLFAYDENGNYSDVHSVSFGVDKYGPQVLIEGVTEGFVYKESVSVITLVKDMFFDEIKTEINGKLIDIKGERNINLEAPEIGARNNRNMYSFTSNGKYTVSLVATDRFNRKAEKTVRFIIDNKAPKVKISFKEEGEDASINSGKMIFNRRPVIKVSASDEVSEYKADIVLFRRMKDGGYETVDSESIVSVGMNTESDITVPSEGEYILKVSLIDDAGNASSKEVNFNVDETAPVIGFLSDFNEKYLKSFSFPKDFRNYIADASDFRYKAFVNSKEIDSARIGRDGKYIVQVVAEDEAGNKSEEMAAFIVDSIAPKVIIEGLSENSQVNKDGHVVLSLLDEDDFFKEILVNGRNIGIDDNRKIDIMADEYGEYDISIVAADYAGNTVTEEVKMHCAYSANPFAVKIDKSDIETLTKNDPEIREKFFEKKGLMKLVIFIGFVVATSVIFVVFSCVDSKENKG